MSSKDLNTKAILKEIREAIKNEKYTEAIEKCEKILKDDSKNYMAFLLLGAAYQNINKSEATKYLYKAIEYSPGPPTVALQGLTNCASTEELPKIYDQLLNLVPEKFNDYCEKLFVLSQKAHLTRECIDIFKREEGKNEPERCKTVLKYLGKIWLANDANVNDDELELFKKALEELIQDETSDIHHNAYKRYLKLLYKMKQLTNCLKCACIVVEQYPNDIYAYEWICKIYCECYNNSQDNDCEQALQHPIENYANKLMELNADSGLAFLIKSIEHFQKQQFVSARDALIRVQKVQPNYPVALELLARTHMKLGAFKLALPLWQQLHKFHKEYAICSSYVEDEDQIRKAIDLLLKEQQDDDVLHALVRCYYKLGNMQEIADLKLSDTLKAEFLLSPENSIELLKSSAIKETFPVLLLLGKSYLKLENHTEALNFMLKATRLNPNWSECFLYLGKIYYAIRDIVRARKCLEKCINLNPMCEEAVNTLSSIYQENKEEDLNVALLLNTLSQMKMNVESQSIHYKLGLHYLQVNKWDDAIQSLRTAIKFNPTHSVYWECLGDAYNERGSYNSAIRVFQKVLEMDPGNLYSRLQLALIKTTVRMYVEAIVDFDSLLKDHIDYLPGLKGIAEAHIGLANNMRLDHRYGCAKDHFQRAINHLQRAFLTPSNMNMVWLWRLSGNVLVQVARLPPSLANLTVSGKLANTTDETSILLRPQLFKLARNFFIMAIKLKSTTYLWYELALCCYYASIYEEDGSSEYLEYAGYACKMAIEKADQLWQNWNLLGVINMHKAINNLEMAQHCFIQAVTLERKAYTVWTNLGTLYLNLNEIKLANMAFKRAQQSNPTYPNAWIGQAMIAEKIFEEEEALDLFRHCQQFEYHPESALGYAHWVCMVMMDKEKMRQSNYKHAIEVMHADAKALDAINWLVIHEETDASVSALSFQGFLDTRQKLYGSAAKSYLQASKNAASADVRDKILTNLGYTYLKLERPNDAITAFNNVSQATFKPIIGLALAYFQAKQYQESYSVYNSVLKSVSETEQDKAAKILVAMASMVYASQGEADTKTILYQCILLKDYPIQALYSACALGILHRDRELTTTILLELKKYEHLEEHCADIAFLTTQHLLSNEKVNEALTYLKSRVHMFPNCGKLRKVMAKFMLEHSPKNEHQSVAIHQMALSAITLEHRNQSKRSDCMEDVECLLIASSAIKPVDKNCALKLVQRAIHLYPQNRKAWQELIEAF